MQIVTSVLSLLPIRKYFPVFSSPEMKHSIFPTETLKQGSLPSSFSNSHKSAHGRGEKKLFRCDHCSNSYVTEIGLRNHKVRWCDPYRKYLKSKKEGERRVVRFKANKNNNANGLLPPEPIFEGTTANDVETTTSTSAVTSAPLRRSTRVSTPRLPFDFENSQNSELNLSSTKPPLKSVVSEPATEQLKGDTELLQNPLPYQHNFSPYDCRYCTHNCSSLEDRAIHEGQMHRPAVKPYHCKICTRRFFYAEDCNFHEKLHEQDYPNMDTKGDEKIEKHSTVADGLPIASASTSLPQPGFKPGSSNGYFNCSFCTQRFINERHLKLHLSWRHKDKGSSIKDSSGIVYGRKTQVPSAIVESQSSSSKLSSKKNSSGKKSIKSKAKRAAATNSGSGGSGTGTTSKSNTTWKSGYVPLLNPDCVTEKNQAYICTLCGQQLRFTYNSIVEHSHAHTGYRPFSCRHCSNNFARVDTVKSHETIHTNQKLHSCHICNRKYRWSSGLYSHINSHKL